MWGNSKHFFLVLPPPPAPALCRPRVRVITPLSEAQDCRFFVFVQFRPADTHLSPKPGGVRDTLFAINAAQGYRGLCVIFCFVFFVLNLF